MRKSKVLVLAMAAVFAISAVAAATASAAPTWKVEGKPLSATETLKTKAEAAFSLKSDLTGGAEVVILCPVFAATNAKIEPTAADSVEKIVFGEAGTNKCTVDTPSACKTAETITTKAITTKLFDEGTAEVWDEYAPTSGTEFVTVAVTGCAGEGSYKITGKSCGKSLEPATEAVTKLQQFGGVPTKEKAKCVPVDFMAHGQHAVPVCRGPPTDVNATVR
jgi:hypothetical protein